MYAPPMRVTPPVLPLFAAACWVDMARATLVDLLCVQRRRFKWGRTYMGWVLRCFQVGGRGCAWWWWSINSRGVRPVLKACRRGGVNWAMILVGESVYLISGDGPTVNLIGRYFSRFHLSLFAYLASRRRKLLARFGPHQRARTNQPVQRSQMKPSSPKHITEAEMAFYAEQPIGAQDRMRYLVIPDDVCGRREWSLDDRLKEGQGLRMLQRGGREWSSLRIEGGIRGHLSFVIFGSD